MPYDDSPVSSAPTGTEYQGNNLVSAAMPSAGATVLSGGSSNSGNMSPSAGATVLSGGSANVGNVVSSPSAGLSSGTVPASSSNALVAKALPAAGATTGAAVPSVTSAVASSSSYAPLDDNKQQALIREAEKIGASPDDLFAIINYETQGTFRTDIKGGEKGKYLGLIQFGPNEQKRYGVRPDQSFEEQLSSAGKYLVDRGYKPGMGVAHMYSIINAGSLKKNGDPRWNARDSNVSLREHVKQISANFYPKPANALPDLGDLGDVQNLYEPKGEGGAKIQLASAAGTLNPSDMSAGVNTYDLGIMGTPAEQLVKQKGPVPVGEPIPMPPAEWAGFQQKLQAGEVPWADLPPSWKVQLAARLGSRAEQAYERVRGAKTAIEAATEEAAPPGGVGRPEIGPELAYADPNAPITEPPAPLEEPSPEPAPIPDVLTPVNVPVPRQRPVVLERRPTFNKLSEAEAAEVGYYQEMLKSLGYYKGKVDGKFGKQTQAAVKAYQKENGLKIDGKIGEATRGTLDLQIDRAKAVLRVPPGAEKATVATKSRELPPPQALEQLISEIMKNSGVDPNSENGQNSIRLMREALGISAPFASNFLPRPETPGALPAARTRNLSEEAALNPLVKSLPDLPPDLSRVNADQVITATKADRLPIAAPRQEGGVLQNIRQFLVDRGILSENAINPGSFVAPQNIPPPAAESQGVLEDIRSFLVQQGVLSPAALAPPSSAPAAPETAAAPVVPPAVRSPPPRTATRALATPPKGISGQDFRLRFDPTRDPKSPEMQAMGTVPAGDRVRPAPVPSPEEKKRIDFQRMYQKLPSGSLYIDPEGVQRRKR